MKIFVLLQARARRKENECACAAVPNHAKDYFVTMQMASWILDAVLEVRTLLLTRLATQCSQLPDKLLLRPCQAIHLDARRIVRTRRKGAAGEKRPSQDRSFFPRALRPHTASKNWRRGKTFFFSARKMKTPLFFVVVVVVPLLCNSFFLSFWFLLLLCFLFYFFIVCRCCFCLCVHPPHFIKMCEQTP